jgi:hypothetical protein
MPAILAQPRRANQAIHFLLDMRRAPGLAGPKFIARKI